jgi:hypothetical protein|tara:strand:+ start:854 stop:3472 length:2619 start_codon:yes stop_codon:yes gene_type:complete
MATLAGNTIASTYPLLLKIDSSGIDGTLRAVQDGDATDSALSIATDSVLVKGSGVRLYFHDADGGEHIAGDGTDLTITSGADIILTAGAHVGIGTTDPSSMLHLVSSTTEKPYIIIENTNADANAPGLKFNKNSSSPAAGDELGQITWLGDDDAGNSTGYANIHAKSADVTNGSEDGSLFFSTRVNDSSTTRMCIVDGKIGIGTTSPGEVLTVNDTIRLDNGDSSIDADQVFGDIEFYDNDGGSASAGVTARIECEAVGAVGGSELNFFTSSSSGGARSSITQQMTIDNNGSVGIGTDAPDTILDVRQSNDGGTTTLNLVNTAGTGSSDETIAITAQHTTSESKGGKIEFFRSGDYSTTGQSQGGIKFYSTDDNTDNLAMTIIKSKYVGIGVASPGAHLHVQDTGVSTTASFTGAQFLHTKTAGTSDASDHMTGLSADMNFNDGSNFFGEMSGAILKATAQAASSGESTFIKGAHIQAEMTGNTDINSIYGIYNLVDINAGEIDSSAYGIFNRVDMESGMSGTFDVYGYYCTTDSDTDKNTYMHYLEGASNTDYHYLNYSATVGSTTSRISDAGQIDAEGTINASQSLDYAEYFESKDGKAIAVGTTVKLDGDKIVACEDGDTPIGAIRPLGASGVVGGAQHFHWQGKHEKDDYDGTVMENFSWTSWTVEVDEAEYYKRRDERERQKYKRVDGSKAIPAKEAVVRQKVVDEEVEKEVTTTSLVDGKYVQKTETVTKTVQVPQYDEVDLYNEDGKVIGNHQVPIMETVEEAVAAVDAVPDTYFKKHKYHTDRIPSGLTAPDDATVIQSKNKRPKLNSSYDASKEESYKSREERDEWCIVGLLGQIPITKGQPLSSNWIKMKDVSDTVEMYFVK